MVRNAGRIKISKPTRADTGLPGKLNIKVSPDVAKLNGFPGFMNTRRKWTAASSDRSGLTRSRSPIDGRPGSRQAAPIRARRGPFSAGVHEAGETIQLCD